jgi:hypothetical protein
MTITNFRSAYLVDWNPDPSKLCFADVIPKDLFNENENDFALSNLT